MPRRRRCENLKILGHRLSDIGCLADYWTGGDRGSSYLSKGRGGEANHVGRGGNEERATGRDPPYDTLIPSPERQGRRQCGESPSPPTNVNKRRDRGKSPPYFPPSSVFVGPSHKKTTTTRGEGDNMSLTARKGSFHPMGNKFFSALPFSAARETARGEYMSCRFRSCKHT